MAATATTIAYNGSAFSRQPVDYSLATYRGGEQARAGPSTQKAEHGESEWRKAHSNNINNSSSYAPPPSSFLQQGPKGKGRSVDHGNGHIYAGDGHGTTGSPKAGERDHQTNRHREAVDPFGRDLGGHTSGQEAASSAHGHTQESYYNDEHADKSRMLTRERGWSGSSKYSESIATFGDGGGSGGGRGMDYLPHTNLGAAVSSHQPSGPTITFPHMHVDVPGDEIGASPIPVRRVQQQHGYGHVRQMSAGRGSASGHNHSDNAERERGNVAPATASPRDSFASFWTFGRGSIRRGQNTQQTPLYAAAATSAEPQWSRVATGSRQPGVGVLRDRSATLGDRIQYGTGMTSDGASQGARPRANTAAQLSVSTSVPAAATLVPPASHIYPPQSQYLQHPGVDAASSSEGGDTYNSSYHHHPYAQVMPPTGHREHSRMVQPTQKRGSLLNLNLNVPFLSSSRSLANLRDSANRLKSSVSTPNLRQGANNSGRSGNGSAPKTPSTAASNKWLSAETWCDALLFPRPRFRMRTAHVISPPDSPTRADTQGPPYSAPPETDTRTAKKNILGRKESREAFQQGSSGQYGNVNGLSQSLGRRTPPRPGHGGGGGSGEVAKSNTLRPPRPKSFAQDDLALLASPVPSLNTVLRQNEDFNKEREQWKTAAAHSFQNKRSRSFSRSHTRAKAMLAARLADDQSELVTSFDIIATSAFHGTQAVKANVSSNYSSSAARSFGNSTGLNTVSTHSRKSSGASGNNNAGIAARGHARKESWSKSALKTAKNTAAGATGLCKFTDDLSPADEKFISLDEVRGQQGDLEGTAMQRVADESGVLLIAPNATYQPHLTLPRANAGAGGAKAISPVPSTQSGDSGTGQSGVGIAVSTPSAFLVPETQEEAFSFSAHPYASPWQKQRSNPGGAVERDLPRPSDYAGPHPSLLTDHLYTDVATHNNPAQHRMPPTAGVGARTTSTSTPPMSHPFASPRARPALLNVPAANGTSRTISPQRSMFAEVGTGTIREVMSDELQYSPYSARHPGSSGRNSDALGVEEALSVAFSRASMENAVRDGLQSGDVDGARRERDGSSRDTSGTASPVPQADSQHVYVVSSHPYRSEMMPQIDEVARESWAASSLTEEVNIGVSNNAALAVPSFSRQQSLPLSVGSGHSRSISHSPGQVSINSSPMASPRQFRKFDDEEDYSDLFYRPGQPSSALGNEVDVRASKISSRPSTGSSSKAITPPALVRSDSGSALTNLQRQLSQSYGRTDGDRRLQKAHNGYNDRMRELQDVDEEVLSSNPGSSPPGTTLPLRVPLSRNQNTDPTHLIPEDVESERASSVMGRYETEEGTEIFYRLGEVPALLTPDPVSKPQRSSAHGSYFGEHGDHSDHNDDTEREINYPRGGRRDDEDDVVLMDHSLTRPRRGHVISSLAAPVSAGPTSATTDGTGTRASYLTSTSSTSRISNLSDFPSPPTQASLTPGRILDSYFSSSTPETAIDGRADPLASADVRSVQREMEREREREARRSRRTTFGPIEEDSDRDMNAHSDS